MKTREQIEKEIKLLESGELKTEVFKHGYLIALRQLRAAMDVVEAAEKYWWQSSGHTKISKDEREWRSKLGKALQCYEEFCIPTSSSGTDSTAKDSDAESSPEGS